MNSLDRFFNLSSADRAAHYRDLANEMRSRAGAAMTKETRDAYLTMAAEWLGMAEKLDVGSGKLLVTVESELASLLRPELF